MEKHLAINLIFVFIINATAQSQLTQQPAALVPGTWVRDLTNTLNIQSAIKNPVTGDVEYYEQSSVIYVGDTAFGINGFSEIVKISKGSTISEYTSPGDTFVGMTAGMGNDIYISTRHGSGDYTYTIRKYNTQTKTVTTVANPIGYCRMIGGNKQKIYFGWQRLWCLDVASGQVTGPLEVGNNDLWTFVQKFVQIGDTLYVAVDNINGDNLVYQVVDTVWTKLIANVTSGTYSIDAFTVYKGKIYMQGPMSIVTGNTSYGITNGGVAVYDIQTQSVVQLAPGGQGSLIVGNDNIPQQIIGTAIFRYIDVATGITDLNTGHFSVFPNPATGYLTIESDTRNDNFPLTSIDGKIVATLHNGSNYIGDLSPAIYFLNKKKIVIQ